MSSRDTKLNIVVDAQNKATSGLRSVSNELNSTAKSAEKSSSSFLGLTSSLVAVAGAYLSLDKVFNAVGLGLTVAADMQTAEVGLKTLLGSSEEASATIKRLKVEAARTPFELPGLTQATQLLTSVTKDGDKSIDILLNVGEALAAMGKGQVELDRIIVNLQQVAAVGKASLVDIKQFAFAGIPIYEMLADTTGKTGEALAGLIEGGGVSFEMLTKMFDEANNEGGRFFNAFVNQSGTFNQASSNMKDSFGIMMQDIVESSGLFDGVTQAMIKASSSMSNWRDVVNQIKDAWFSFKDLVINAINIFDEKTLVITHFTGVFKSLWETLKTQLKPALDDLWLALQPLMPYIQAFGQMLAITFIVALHGVATAFRVIGEVITVALTALTILATFIVDTAVGVFRTLQNAVEFLAAVFTGDWGGAIESVKNQISDLINWVGDLIDLFKRAIDLSSKLVTGPANFLKKALPGRASGGPVTGNSPYIVGEVGPELFVPSSSGTIIPNHKLGGGGLSITITGNTFMSDEDSAEKIGDMIMSRLRLSNAL